MGWKVGFVRGDRRQIQTAVLGGAASEVPLVLPLEAIELDAFRRQHEQDTFWCGLLLGGCGIQLTTKLYVDRVCHFAHHPGPDGMPHCGRSARGVASADHLYVKSAAAAWLRGCGVQADVDFGRPIGSVLDIRFESRGLRVHLDAAVAPVWDEDGREPVLGVSVPVDQDTLISRWYIHRIRLDSEGTSRRVRIGTEAFARDVEWFGLDECEMTERGLSTPAVERIVRSRGTRPSSTWGAGKADRKVPDALARAQLLLRKLADARRVESVLLVTQVSREISAMPDVPGEMRSQLTAAVADAARWLAGQAEVRRDLFARLEGAVAARNPEETGQLLVRVNAAAGHDRTATENAVVDSAAAYLAALAQQRQADAAAVRAVQEDLQAQQAADQVRKMLAELQRNESNLSRQTRRRLVNELVHAATLAGDRVDAAQQWKIDYWKTKADAGKPPVQTTRSTPVPAPRTPRPKQSVPLHEQLSRGLWLSKPCPACDAARGMKCLNDDATRNKGPWQIPHDERLRLIISERKSRASEKQRAARPEGRSRRSQTTSQSPRVTDIVCPTCGARPGSRCTTPDGHPHYPRVAQFRRRFSSH
ncbi:hypothetical protein ACFWIB_30950 [Streptomyces sp. NPDC127051]|uniref:hypothetical protein n=1 Tax=Streptomyces sp. NPDC127051 TaxID=3347119 RepID=UPI003649E0D3